MIDDLALARTLHVAAVVLWIGGVAFVTTVLMPAIRRRHPPGERLATFHAFEGRFAAQARLWVLLAGLSGGWMIGRGGMLERFADLHFWWMHAMLLLWIGFAAMLFVAEPLVAHRRLADPVTPAAVFDRMQRMHNAVLVLSLLTVMAAVAGSHGLI